MFHFVIIVDHFEGFWVIYFFSLKGFIFFVYFIIEIRYFYLVLILLKRLIFFKVIFHYRSFTHFLIYISVIFHIPNFKNHDLSCQLIHQSSSQAYHLIYEQYFKIFDLNVNHHYCEMLNQQDQVMIFNFFFISLIW